MSMQHTVTQRKTDNNPLIPLLANQAYLQGRTVLYSLKLQLFRSFFLSPSLPHIHNNNNNNNNNNDDDDDDNDGVEFDDGSIPTNLVEKAKLISR